MAKLKGQQPATNSRPGNTTLHYYKLLPKHYPALLHITTYNITSYCFYITSIFFYHITSYYSKITLSITTYYYIRHYFVLLPNYFHITSTLLAINPKPSLILLHITTQYITSYYYKITFILLHYYFQLLPKGGLLRITTIGITTNYILLLYSATNATLLRITTIRHYFIP